MDNKSEKYSEEYSEDNNTNYDYFSPGQFQNLSDSEKLNAPPFEKLHLREDSDKVYLQIGISKGIFNQLSKLAKKQNVGIQHYVGIVLTRLFSRKKYYKQ